MEKSTSVFPPQPVILRNGQNSKKPYLIEPLQQSETFRIRLADSETTVLDITGYTIGRFYRVAWNLKRKRNSGNFNDLWLGEKVVTSADERERPRFIACPAHGIHTVTDEFRQGLEELEAPFFYYKRERVSGNIRDAALVFGETDNEFLVGKVTREQPYEIALQRWKELPDHEDLAECDKIIVCTGKPRLRIFDGT